MASGSMRSAQAPFSRRFTNAASLPPVKPWTITVPSPVHAPCSNVRARPRKWPRVCCFWLPRKPRTSRAPVCSSMVASRPSDSLSPLNRRDPVSVHGNNTNRAMTLRRGHSMSGRFGGVIQNGYVVRDIEAAMRHWIDVLGVGPWFYIDHLPVADFQYKGQPSPVDISLALANSGTLQIELIQQRNDAPSLYLDFLRAGHEGLQHLGYGTRVFEADLARLLARGYTMRQAGRVPGRGSFDSLWIEWTPC